MIDSLSTDPETGEPLPSPVTAITSVDTLFFYAQSGTNAPVLKQVNLRDGTLAVVQSTPELFPTALSGLLTAEPTEAPWLIDLGLPDATGVALADQTPLGGDERLPTSTQPASAEVEPQVFTLVVGSDRKNFLLGADDNSALFGLGGDDLILVGQGDNLAFGGKGNDTILGGLGDNIFFGNLGDDVLEGGEGDDTLFGGEGADILSGGAGANVLIGGAGADLFRLGKPEADANPLVGESDVALEPDHGPDIIVDFSLAEGDVIDLSLIAAQSVFAGSDLLPFLSVVQVGAHTHLRVTTPLTPLGQTTTEAILLNVEADTLTPEAFSVTPPDDLPLFK
jgi:Ca2+-binding RTX toxin-like protein